MGENDCVHVVGRDPDIGQLLDGVFVGGDDPRALLPEPGLGVLVLDLRLLRADPRIDQNGPAPALDNPEIERDLQDLAEPAHVIQRGAWKSLLSVVDDSNLIGHVLSPV
jgi:hypothetical protein